MKFSFVLLPLVFFSLAAPALTKSEAYAKVRECRKVLKLPLAEQAAAAKRQGIPLARGLRSCRLLVSLGEEGAWQGYRREQKQQRRVPRRSAGGASEDDRRSCMASASCSSMEHCVFGACVPTSHVCGGDPACPSGESCKDNRCQ